MFPTSRSESSAVTQTKGGSALPEGMSIATPPSAAEVRDKVVVQHVRKAHTTMATTTTAAAATTTTTTTTTTITLLQTRKAHNAWGKTKKEFQATIDRSRNHVKTKGNKLEVIITTTTTTTTITTVTTTTTITTTIATTTITTTATTTITTATTTAITTTRWSWPSTSRRATSTRAS